jgi:hypothetical protein
MTGLVYRAPMFMRACVNVHLQESAQSQGRSRSSYWTALNDTRWGIACGC